MAAPDSDLEAVLVAAREGSVEAWSYVIEEFGPLVSAYAKAVAFDDPDGEVGDIFEEAAKGIDCFDGGRDELCIFLFDIAVAHRRASDRAGPAGRGVVDRAPVPEVARLHPDIRDAVLLARIADIPPSAIADILEVDRSTVVEWQRQGLDALGR